MNSHLSALSLHVLLVDADEPLGQALATELRAFGHHVTTHARDAASPVDVHIGDLTERLDALAESHGPFDRVIFGLRPDREKFELPSDVRHACEYLGRSLGELRAVAQMLARGDDTQIWVLLPEDSMQYYLDVPSQPVRSRALTAAVKSLAKEVFGFGIRLNALQVQPLAEHASPAAWREAREGLRAYALKFKPQACADVARLLHSLLGQARLPLAGLVLPVGVGFPETNV
jgi:hypothetical protein